MAKCRVPGRYLLLALLFVGNTILSTHKFDLGIAILAMTNQVPATDEAASLVPDDSWLQHDNDTVARQFNTSGTAVVNGSVATEDNALFTTTPAVSLEEKSTGAPAFSWSPSVQGVILGAYFYGVIMPQVLGGRLAERFSAKWTLLAGLLASSALTSATPWIATLGVAPLVAHRILLGFVHGLSMPSSVALVARWAPRRERSTFVAVVFCGRYMGIVVATLLFGHLSSMSVAGGWPFAFYMSGLLGFLWLALWYFLAFDDPACDPKVSAAELHNIQGANGGGPLRASTAKRPLPWRAVLTSAPVWALVAARFSNLWVSMLLFTKLPAYVEGVLGMSLRQNANFSALVFAFTIVSVLGSGVIADCLLRCGLQTTLVRKAFQLTSNFGPALCLLCLTTAGTNRWLVLFLLFIGKITLGAFTAGNAAAVVDLAPMYSATLNGMITTFGQTTGVLAPLVAGLLSSSAKGDKMTQWTHIFYLAAAVSFAGGVVFAIFGSAERQPWADPSGMATTKQQQSVPPSNSGDPVASAEDGVIIAASTALLGTPASPDTAEMSPAKKL
ncbi:sodium-dependent phosphate transport protein 3-like isoform X2 [Dermacentor variabilis]|uniref:sodium-dependent phosphate transport protein 3-like isoform X2 n=1 Tax=Dermacentor variabilis TaxID=34621 RepID=UPI003F5BA72C